MTTEPSPSAGAAGPAAARRAGLPELPCVFRRALLAQAAACELARRGSVGERETVECRAPAAHANCETMVALMRERARFALRLPAADAPLRHAQAMQLECGGILGLARALGAPATPPEVHALVLHAQQRHGSLAELPWDEVVGAMRAWAPRRRRPA
ncbi:MAG: hypothetical protein HYZ20_10530 [Burkholderiales bacterium]|nr:hypothetical protein [Burkholderiales bacterium]